jgi:3'(2'), 5'-bisphosphate nucleotidase
MNAPVNPDPDITTLAPELIAVAKAAGRAIMRVYESGDFGTVSKDDDSPLTRADLASNGVILEALQGLTPDIPVLSEESKRLPYAERKDWKRFWLVDPLDGTKEFIKRNGEFTVNIALIEGDAPVFGVVHAPALNLTYWAAAGVGAFKGRDTRLEAATYEGGALKLVASRSHAGAATEALVAELERDAPVELVSIGSSLKLCLVADGQAHLYPRFGPTMEWDTAAAHCVAEQAGATVREPGGAALRYNKENLLNPHFIVTKSDDLFARATRVSQSPAT